MQVLYRPRADEEPRVLVLDGCEARYIKIYLHTYKNIYTYLQISTHINKYLHISTSIFTYLHRCPLERWAELTRPLTPDTEATWRQECQDSDGDADTAWLVTRYIYSPIYSPIYTHIYTHICTSTATTWPW